MTLVERAEQLIRDCEIGAGCGVCPVLRELLATVASQAHTLAQLTAERDACKRDWQAELDGNAALRQEFGARDDETFYAFIKRLAEAQAHTRPEPGGAVCRECGCMTGGGAYCYEHAPYTITPLKDGSWYEDRNGGRKRCWKADPPGSTPTVASSSPETAESVISLAHEFLTQKVSLLDGSHARTLIRSLLALLVQRTEELRALATAVGGPNLTAPNDELDALIRMAERHREDSERVDTEP